jgi:hypothetical protein
MQRADVNGIELECDGRDTATRSCSSMGPPVSVAISPLAAPSRDRSSET